MCHFGSRSGTQKFNFHIKTKGKLCITANLSRKMASSLSQVANQLIMKYYSKFLASSICQNILIACIKKITIVNILG